MRSPIGSQRSTRQLDRLAISSSSPGTMHQRGAKWKSSRASTGPSARAKDRRRCEVTASAIGGHAADPTIIAVPVGPIGDMAARPTGGVTRVVSERYSSQTCSVCGCIPASSPKGLGALGVRQWRWNGWGALRDRNINSARSIEIAGVERRPRNPRPFERGRR